jgi:alkylmercury lyase
MPDFLDTEPNFDVKEIAAALVALFPRLTLEEQRLSLELYRLLAEGQPVTIQRLADRLGHSSEDVANRLHKWPGVFFNEQQDVFGYWGLSPTYETGHRLRTDGPTLYAWCAWDTLFLPALLGKTAEVESVSPQTLTPVRMTVAPHGVQDVEPQGVVMSFVMPNPDRFQDDVVTSFCHFLHFFPSRHEGEAWAAGHHGARILTVEAAFELGRHKNRLQYPDFVL